MYLSTEFLSASTATIPSYSSFLLSTDENLDEKQILTSDQNQNELTEIQITTTSSSPNDLFDLTGFPTDAMTLPAKTEILTTTKQSITENNFTTSSLDETIPKTELEKISTNEMSSTISGGNDISLSTNVIKLTTGTVSTSKIEDNLQTTQATTQERTQEILSKGITSTSAQSTQLITFNQSTNITIKNNLSTVDQDKDRNLRTRESSDVYSTNTDSILLQSTEFSSTIIVNKTNKIESTIYGPESGVSETNSFANNYYNESTDLPVIPETKGIDELDHDFSTNTFQSPSSTIWIDIISGTPPKILPTITSPVLLEATSSPQIDDKNSSTSDPYMYSGMQH